MDLYRIECEWDIGADSLVFASKHAAREWAEPVLKAVGIEEPLDVLEGDGLFSIKPLHLEGFGELVSIGWVSLVRDHKTGELRQRVNGGSSTPSSRKVYRTRGIAGRYGVPAEAFICEPTKEATK